MGARDPRVDAYIERSAPFARPILTHLREVVHEACPAVEETMKWSFPHFMYEGILCSMASFKQHCAFGFWKGALVLGGNGKSAEAMGSFGRITALADLPSRATLRAYVKKAMALNEAGVTTRPAKHPRRRAALPVPAYFTAALRRNRQALATFQGFSPSHQREYVEWVTEAKGEETRRRRLATAIEWMAEGKSRHWKYAKK